MDTLTEQLRVQIEKIQKYEAMEAEIAKRRSEADDLVELNVGGEAFTTLRSTLTKYPDTMLGAMFSGRHAITKDPQGRAFLDRDPEIFKILLQWLRSGLVPKVSDAMAPFLAVELDYYGLTTVFSPVSVAQQPPPPVAYSAPRPSQLSKLARFLRRDAIDVADWMDEIGLKKYGRKCIQSALDGKTLVRLTDRELEAGLGIEGLQLKRLRAELDEIKNSEK